MVTPGPAALSVVISLPSNWNFPAGNSQETGNARPVPLFTMPGGGRRRKRGTGKSVQYGGGIEGLKGEKRKST